MQRFTVEWWDLTPQGKITQISKKYNELIPTTLFQTQDTRNEKTYSCHLILHKARYAFSRNLNELFE